MKIPTKVNVPPGAGGSFRKPDSLKRIEAEEVQKRREAAEEDSWSYSKPVKEEPVEDLSQAPTETQEVSGGWKAPEKETLPTPADPEPKEISDILKPQGVLDSLKTMGVEITEQDIENYLFQGYVEKNVVVFKMSEKEDFTAKIRTLSSKHYMAVEERIADYLRVDDMTREGLGSLRTLCVLSLAVTGLMGRPTIGSWGDEANPTPEVLRRLSTENMKVIEELAPGVVNKINVIHASLTTAFNRMLDDGNSPFLIGS